MHLVTDPTLARVIGFFDTYHQCWALIEKEKTLIYCKNTTFAYDNEFKDYVKVDEVVSEDIFDYLFDVGARKFLSVKEKKYVFELFEKWDPEHLQQLDENFDHYPNNNGMEDIIGDEKLLHYCTI